MIVFNCVDEYSFLLFGFKFRHDALEACKAIFCSLFFDLPSNGDPSFLRRHRAGELLHGGLHLTLLCVGPSLCIGSILSSRLYGLLLLCCSGLLALRRTLLRLRAILLSGCCSGRRRHLGLHFLLFALLG